MPISSDSPGTPETPPRYRGRFAPSPTGDLHFGSLLAALGSWLRARAVGGAWVVRVEDLDPPREVSGASARILATLAAFGMESDEAVLYQSRREPHYAAALQRLLALGAAFECRCSRTDLGSGGLHHGCVPARRGPLRPAAWRVRAPDLDVGFDDLLRGHQRQNLQREVGDFVVRRVEGWYAYQLAVVVDDAAQGITEIVRGADLLDSTPRQIWLQRLLDLATPGYAHLPLVLGADGHKLSKQSRSQPVQPHDPLPALRAALLALGVPSATFAGLATVPLLLQRGIEQFRVDRIPLQPARDARTAFS